MKKKIYLKLSPEDIKNSKNILKIKAGRYQEIKKLSSDNLSFSYFKLTTSLLNNNFQVLTKLNLAI